MEDGVITFDNLYETLRLEKYKTELQRIDKSFYKKLLRYLEEKKAILRSQESKDSVFANDSITKTKRQLDNSKMLLKELYEKRETKIIDLALSSSRASGTVQDADALLEDERDMYNELVNLFNGYRKNVLYNLLDGREPEKVIVKGESKAEDKKNQTVRFVEPVPKFLGDDLNIYGPYEAEDMANLPVKIVEILVKNKRVEVI